MVLLAKLGIDTAEKEPSKLGNISKICYPLAKGGWAALPAALRGEGAAQEQARRGAPRELELRAPRRG